MKKPAKTTLEVKGTAITVLSQNETDYICLTDIARYKDADRTDYLISNWLRNRNTAEFLGIREQLHNPGFNPIEFDGIRKQAGLNSFILTAIGQMQPLTASSALRHLEPPIGGKA